MTFLIGLAAQIGEWLLAKLFAFIGKEIAVHEKQAAEVDQAKAEKTALVGAQTEAEVDKAARDSLNNI